MRIFISIFLILSTVTAVQAEKVWLVVAASDPTPAGIAMKAKRLGNKGGLIFQTTDCGERKTVFALAANIEGTSEAATRRLKEIKEVVPDAYVKKCDVKQGSLLDHRFPAVDLTIADVPSTAVNWDDKDRIATIEALCDGSSLIFSRYFDNEDRDDPLEGRRVRVVLMLKGEKDKGRELENNCIDPAMASTSQGFIALQCAREQAGDHFMHSVVLFDSGGTKVNEIQHCRNPVLVKRRSVRCDTESVSADGSLKLQPRINPF